ncbi:MAG: hypothetical protein ACSHX7_00385 [Luteolibacter sp.]
MAGLWPLKVWREKHHLVFQGQSMADNIEIEFHGFLGISVLLRKRLIISKAADDRSSPRAYGAVLGGGF